MNTEQIHTFTDLNVPQDILDNDPDWSYKKSGHAGIFIYYRNEFIDVADTEEDAHTFIREIEENLSFYDSIGLLKLKIFK